MSANTNNFKAIAPRKRSQRATMKDKESIEIRRLQQRVGGYHVYVDSGEVFRPDPTSTHFISEAQRFDKDFNVADGFVRQAAFTKKQDEIIKLRYERLKREDNRYEQMNREEAIAKQRLECKRDVYQAGKKNKGGAAFDIINLDYQKSKDGQKLANLDNDAMVRALMRSKVLDKKNNGGYNPVTGSDRPPIPVPAHERYNPISSAGRQMLSSSRRSAQPPASSNSMKPPSSKRSQLPPSQRSAMPASQRSGLPPSQRSAMPPPTQGSSHSRIFGGE
jgi:hypothetical protein